MRIIRRLVPIVALAAFIPAAALALLQPSATGVIKVSGQSTPGTFTAEVVGGGQTDAGDFTSKIEVSKSVVVQ